LDEGFVVGIRSFVGNSCGGETLNATVDQWRGRPSLVRDDALYENFGKLWSVHPDRPWRVLARSGERLL
jgi:hypothetical protein